MSWTIASGLEGKGVIVTGAAGGIGRAVVAAFAAAGCRVANGLGIQTMPRFMINDNTMRELIGIPADADFGSAESVQAMVVWADAAANPKKKRLGVLFVDPSEFLNA